MQLKFKVDDESLTFGDLLDMESGKISAMAGVMSRCMVDNNGALIPEKEALKKLRSIPVSQLKDATDQFGQALDAFKEGAVPPIGGDK